MSVLPIAIIGQACVLPEALTPEQLWELIVQGKEAITDVPTGHWRADTERLLITAADFEAGKEGCISRRGGFIRGFDTVFDPSGFALDADLLASLDVSSRWLLHTGREALRSCGLEAGDSACQRIGAIVGNLAYPSAGLSKFAEAKWLATAGLSSSSNAYPINRFSSGLPTHLLCRALGLGAGGFALDAACASSLYAIKLACDKLRNGSADAMLAGGLCGIDGLNLHSGFTALKALSPSGQSRPFHRDADGLLPSEGAALVVLKRLPDAIRDGDNIQGVIRGIGLSNDGRSGGFLVPSTQGQVRAMRAAYAQADLSPERVSLIECHATGTITGDTTEIRALTELYAGLEGDFPIGSLKSNLGHLITASGAAGLIKVLQAMRHGIRPATLNAEPTLSAMADSPLRLLTKAEPWNVKGAKVAAISGFGFGGTNAHLLVEEWLPSSATQVFVQSAPILPARIAVVGLGASVADGKSVEDFRCQLYAGKTNGERIAPMENISLNARSLRFPPNDLALTLPQQLAMLAVIDEALLNVKAVASERSSVLVGMQCDVEAARNSFRLRLPDINPQIPLSDTGVTPLQAATVIGCMPNIPANRINIQHDFKGASFSVFAEEISGLRALELAVSALRNNETDMAIVGAVDLCVEPVHQAAALAILPTEHQKAGDAACAVILKREEDALRDGDTIHAIIETDSNNAAATLWTNTTAAIFGHAHAASGLVEVLAALLTVRDGVHAGTKSHSAMPWIKDAEPRSVRVELTALGGQSASVSLSEPAKIAAIPVLPENPTDIFFYRANSRAELLVALSENRLATSDMSEQVDTELRLVILANDAQREQRTAQAIQWLHNPQQPRPEGVFFGEGLLQGEVAFVFTGAAAAYPVLGREQVLALPRVLAEINKHHPHLSGLIQTFYGPANNVPLDGYRQLCACSFLCQFHAELTRNILRIVPDVVIGLSSGETNALFAMDVWQDIEGLLRSIDQSGIYTQELAGEYLAVKDWWQTQGIEGNEWAQYQILAPVAEVRAALASEPAVHLAIICSPVESVIAGEAQACERVIHAFRQRNLPVNLDLAVHTPAIGRAEKLWHDLHHRPTVAPEGIRFYANAHKGAYALDDNSVAAALTAQAVGTVDFPSTILQAWEDGVRVFIEHGPRGECSRWISETLGDRPHLAVALDKGARGSLGSLLETVAELLVAGITLDLPALRSSLSLDKKISQSLGKELLFAAHLPPMTLTPPAISPIFATMTPAPTLSLFIPEQIQRIALSSPVAKLTLPNNNALLHKTLVKMHEAMTHAHQDYLTQAQALYSHHLRLESLLLPQKLNLTTVSPASVAPPTVKEPTPIFEAPVQTPVREEIITKPIQAPLFSRSDLEVLASGRIADIFGEPFACQDAYIRQVRMPEPPLLLCDRVMSITGEAGSMKTGIIYTETDVLADAWYLHNGHMPAGITIESGQADLLLISWLGADFENRGERVYRLLGCELTFEGSLPKIGDTLCYDIHVDGHASQGDVRLFFFHYDCHIAGQLRVKVRNGQAGFFTDQELAQSAGVLWDPETAQPSFTENSRLDAPETLTDKRTFDSDAVRAFSEGRLVDCFGASFFGADYHTRTPSIHSGVLRLINEVPVFEPSGGPWQRGYLRGEWALSPDDWFFKGHFKNDPCMPGTLMLEACLQAMAFYVTALGYTLNHDGWRFEPVPDETYKLICRGQATPSSKRVVYEVFVEEIIASPYPTLYADVLATVDGLKAFYCHRIGLRLVPAWPLDEQTSILATHIEPKPVAKSDGFSFGYHSLLACATGRPSEAFGELYSRFDSHRLPPRLPAPPYLFMTRICSVSEPIGTLRIGTEVFVEYDIPVDDWYFDANGYPTMPYAVLLEAALQPCGWLASYVGCALQTEQDVFFRNLDGTATQLAEIPPNGGVLTTRSRLTSLSTMGAMTIVGFDVDCKIDDTLVYQMTTVFGFFPAEALANQVGLPVTPEEKVVITALDNIDLQPALLDKTAILAKPPLLMLDSINAYWSDGGRAGLGMIRGEKHVTAKEWFFKAHFFQDPVQPGSLGIEALLQLLQCYMLQSGMLSEFTTPRFEPIALNRPATWKYRGQVVPTNNKITTLVEVLERGTDDQGAYAVAAGSLWVDGKKIYEMSAFAMRVVESSTFKNEEVLNPFIDHWLLDHCPTFVIPALPMMSMVERLAAASKTLKQVLTGLENVSLYGWVSFLGEPKQLRTRVENSEDTHLKEVILEVLHKTPREGLSVYRRVATATAILAASYPKAPPVMVLPEDGVVVHNPEAGMNLYAEGCLFHGASFQVLQHLSRAAASAIGLLDAQPRGVPCGLLNPALLDGITHCIPNDALEQWSERIQAGQIGYPSKISRLSLFAAIPQQGIIECRVKLLTAEPQPVFHAQLVNNGQVILDMELLYALFPKGSLGSAAPADRLAFLRDHRFVAGLGLSRMESQQTRLTQAEINACDWLSGTVASVYDTNETTPTVLAIKDHLAQRYNVHPRLVVVSPDLDSAIVKTQPLLRIPLQVLNNDGEVLVCDNGQPTLDTTAVRTHWQQWFNKTSWPIEDIFFGLLETFLDRLCIVDPEALSALKGKPVILLANHQVGIESLLFSVLSGYLLGSHPLTLAKIEHKNSWIGSLMQQCFSYPDITDPDMIAYFDRDNPASLPKIIANLHSSITAENRHLIVHVEGTRALSCRTPVTKMSGVFLDLAITAKLPVIPVRFSGGLPVEPADTRLEFPIGMGRQDYFIGEPIMPEMLESIPYKQRVDYVMKAINELGSPSANETPKTGNGEIEQFVRHHHQKTGVSEEWGVILHVLNQQYNQGRASQEIQLILKNENINVMDLAREAWLKKLNKLLFVHDK